IAAAYCPGITLAQWLHERPGPVGPRLAAALLAVLADAVQHAHSRGIVHRDLKPGNILLVPRAADGSDGLTASADDLGFIPNLTDLGLAKLLEGGRGQTAPGVVLGPPGYMAPEQLQGSHQDVGPAADLYALGVLLHELLTRRLPQRGQVLLPPQLPPELGAL